MSLDPTTYKSIIESHVAMATNEHKEWDQLRNMYRCQQWGDTDTPGGDADLRTETGSVYAYTDTMIASIVPPNPQITCNARKPSMNMAAKYREALVNDTLRRSKADLVLWKLATHASVYPRGILKAVWNKRLRRPDFIVVDPRNFFFDLTAARYEDVRYVIEAFPLTEAEFNARIHGPNNPRGLYDANVARRAQFGSYPAWLKDPQSGRAELDDKLRKVFKWTVVFEVFDFTTPRGRYYHFLLGHKEPLFEGDLPYVFLPNPYGLLTFNDNLEDAGGLADAKIVKGPVERLDELRTLKLRFAQSTIPITVLNEAEVDDPEATADQLAHANSPGDMVRVKVKNGRSISDVIGQTPTANLSPAFDQMDQTLDNEILYRLGMPQYSRGVAGTSQVATELALVDAALRTRQGRRSELVNHMIVFMAKAVVGLYEEYMTGDDMLPVRLGPGKFLEIARQHLAARNPEEADAALNLGETLEEPLDIDFEVVPYSPVENSKTAQLQKMEKFMPVFLNNPLVKQEKFLAKLAEMLDIGEGYVISEQEIAAQKAEQAKAAMAMMPQGGAGPEGAPAGPPVEAGATSTLAALRGGELPTAVPTPPGITTGARPGMAGGAGFSTPEG